DVIDCAALEIVSGLRVRFALLPDLVHIGVESETKPVNSGIETEIIGDLISRRVEQARTRAIAAKRPEAGNHRLPCRGVWLFKSIVGRDLNANFVDDPRT